MSVNFHLITGVSLGIEYIEEDEEDEIPNAVVLDLFILRIFLEW